MLPAVLFTKKVDEIVRVLCQLRNPPPMDMAALKEICNPATESFKEISIPAIESSKFHVIRIMNPWTAVALVGRGRL